MTLHDETGNTPPARKPDSSTLNLFRVAQARAAGFIPRYAAVWRYAVPGGSRGVGGAGPA